MMDAKTRFELELAKKIVHLVITEDAKRLGLVQNGTKIVDHDLILGALATASAAITCMTPSTERERMQRAARFEHIFEGGVADIEGRGGKRRHAA